MICSADLPYLKLGDLKRVEYGINGDFDIDQSEARMVFFALELEYENYRMNYQARFAWGYLPRVIEWLHGQEMQQAFSHSMETNQYLEINVFNQQFRLSSIDILKEGVPLTATLENGV